MRTLYGLIVISVLASSSALAAKVEQVDVPSAKMGKTIPATLILPDAYTNAMRRFPVLYLLHGAGDTHSGWNERTDIAALADEYEVIVFCPDGGKTSWYFDSPLDFSYQYETFVARECVEYLDRRFRTLASRDYRALCGLSMGGHGALFLAIRHPTVFSMAVALSGGVDIRPFPNKWKIRDRIGDIKVHPEDWEAYTVINLAKNLKDGDLALVLDCGESDFFLEVNRALHAQWVADGISHVYVEKPGAHNWAYWQAAIHRQMPAIAEHFKRAGHP